MSHLIIIDRDEDDNSLGDEFNLPILLGHENIQVGVL